MTRDEAIKIMSRIWGDNPQHGLANSYVDAFVAIGMLKLDEPPSVLDRALDAFSEIGISSRALCALDKAGLKIVEK